MVACLRVIALMAAIILRCGFAFADDAAFSAHDLMAGCRAYLRNNISTEDYFAAKYCAEIIDGLVGAGPGLCPPASATQQQIVRAVVTYIDGRPARLQESFQKLASEALGAAFPCQH